MNLRHFSDELGLALLLAAACAAPAQDAFALRDGDRVVYISRDRDGPLGRVEEFLDILDD